VARSIPAVPVRIAQVERYVIRGGKEGYERLLLLARDRWPDTAALFQRAGLSPGMRCIDLGCGGGEVTFEIAGLVAPGGSVTGVDMDAIKLGLARRKAAQSGLGHVEFRQLDVADWDEPGSYDAVYCRVLLQHLSQPVDLLRRMWAAVRPGGVILVEDADFDGWCCHPPNEGLDFFVRTYQQVLQRRGGDHALGRKLYGYFLAVGIPRPQVALVQSVRTEGEGKTLAWSTLEATAEAIASERVATREEVTAALTDLQRFTADPRTLICGPRIFQLWSRRQQGPTRHLTCH
jgi:ubiquinone/menaquinone biosynthesis C-methylase UbiE